jgi:hypothetical protein
MFGSELIQSSLSNDKGDTVVEYPKQKDPFHKNATGSNVHV